MDDGLLQAHGVRKLLPRTGIENVNLTCEPTSHGRRRVTGRDVEARRAEAKSFGDEGFLEAGDKPLVVVAPHDVVAFDEAAEQLIKVGNAAADTVSAE
jgi:hypothetical protein